MEIQNQYANECECRLIQFCGFLRFFFFILYFVFCFINTSVLFRSFNWHIVKQEIFNVINYVCQCLYLHTHTHTRRHSITHTQAQLTWHVYCHRSAVGRILNVELLPPVAAHPQRNVLSPDNTETSNNDRQQKKNKKSSIRIIYSSNCSTYGPRPVHLCDNSKRHSSSLSG